METGALYQEAVELLKMLIAEPSFSKEEEKTAAIIADFFEKKGLKVQKKGNNVWVHNKYYDPDKPTILLNSHHDTVKPNTGYTRNPYSPDVEGDKLYGLGSNDAGGPLASLVAAFLHFYEKENLKYNLVLAASAEEEISGKNGIESVLPDLGTIDFAIVGEPTKMAMAIAEKGLMVLDCVAHGKSGHAARDEGQNAIYKAIRDIEWFKYYQFPEISPLLGPVKMNVTIIHSGTQHNVVPDRCEFTVDVRTTEVYSNEATLEIIRKHVGSDVTARSTRLNPSGIPASHPIVQAGKALALQFFGSPTLSDQALMPFPSVKIGPGDSARSHTADEYINLPEIKEGIELYIKLLEKVIL